MALEYCWTRSPTNEDDVGPGLGWSYYGSYIRGDVTSGLWRLTRWAKESGETSVFIAESLFANREKPNLENLPQRTPVYLRPQSVTYDVTITRNTPEVTPPEIPQGDDTAAARLARALQLLKS